MVSDAREPGASCEPGKHATTDNTCSIENLLLWTSIYLKIILKSAVEQRCSGAGAVGHHGHQEEGRVIGEDIIE